MPLMLTLMNSLGPLRPLRKTSSWCSPFTWLNVLQLCYAKFLTTRPRCYMTLRMKCCFCLSSGFSPSIENCSTRHVAISIKDSEVRRAASGLVKVLCTVNDSTSGGKGSRKGNEWFGSMSLMNTLYVWFPASWGPSVVEALSSAGGSPLSFLVVIILRVDGQCTLLKDQRCST